MKTRNKNIVHIYGGLGNQMFQYAFYRFLLRENPESYINTGYFGNRRAKARHGSEYLLPLVFRKISETSSEDRISKIMYSDKLQWKLHRIARKIIYRKTRINDTFPLIEEYKQGSIPEAGVSHFRSYWQEVRFAQDIENELRDIFEFDLAGAGERNMECRKAMKKDNSVSIHIRRGDYLEKQDIYGNICTPGYYENAISMIGDRVADPVFYIFSDDISWCRKHFNHLKKSTFVDWNRRESYFDMMLMSQCKHNIIANSSFSWWAAWLNDSAEKIVVLPEKWTDVRSSILIRYEGCLSI